jgi:hypothetical protein
VLGPSISAARMHQPHLTSETMDAGVHVKEGDAREGGRKGQDAFGRVKWVS